MNSDVPEESGPSEEAISPVPIDERYDFSDGESISFEKFRTPTNPDKTEWDGSAAILDTHENAASTSDPLIGRTIGNYKILSLLGKGGFGSVYKARDAKLHRSTAIKFLHYPQDPEFHRRFEQEARVLGELSKHPNIVQIYSWGEHEGKSYFALEHLDYSCDVLVKQSPEGIPLLEALQIGTQCAKALAHAHSHGVLHRDIKPANILMDESTHIAKLCDFGLALLTERETDQHTTIVAGSPAYMSPEQASGKEIDERSDIYSLGITLYRLLSGEVPYKGSTYGEIYECIIKSEGVPLTKIRPDLPQEVSSIIERCIKANPDDRFQTARELEHELKALITQLERSGQVVPEKRRESRKDMRIPALAAITVVAIVLAYMGWILSGGQLPGASLDFLSELEEAEELLDEGQFDEASVLLGRYTAKYPKHRRARTMFGFALLGKNDVDAARRVFETLSSDQSREEGLLAIRHHLEGADCRSALERHLEQYHSPYIGVLLGAISLSEGDYSSAITTLETIRPQELSFNWQRHRHQDLLGRAYYKSGDYEHARSLLGDSTSPSTGWSSQIAHVYAEMAGEQLDQTRREEARQQLKTLRERTKQMPKAGDEPVDDWTSRPLRVAVLPSSPGRSRFAVDSGFVDVLPGLLVDALAEVKALPIKVMNRENIAYILFEQELSEMSSDEERVRARKLIGVHMMIESEFEHLFNADSVRIKVTNTETSELTQVPALPVDRKIDVKTWVNTLAENVVQRIRKAYPIQGRLMIGPEGPIINVGANVGVSEGMRFSVLKGPGIEHTLENLSVSVPGSVRPTETSVALDGFDPSAIPAEGWYVREIAGV